MTLLIGRNNAGKTSSYAPLLLLRQTLDARDKTTALLFRGGLADFGSFGDVVTDHDATSELRFYLDFGELPAGQSVLLSGNEPLRPRALEIAFRQDRESERVRLVRSTVFDDDGDRVVSRFRQASGLFRVTSPFLPENNEVGRPYKEVTELRRALTGEEPTGFLFSGTGGLWLPRAWREDKDRWQKVQGWYQAASKLFDLYYSFNQHLEGILHNIAYIGPLRSSPQRTYLLSAEPPVDVGRDGESATEVLYQSSKGRTHGVLERTNEWLAKLGYGELAFEAAGDYYQVFVTDAASGMRVNIADCGMGLSQLLPLLVQGCVLEKGATLIAQQPEIHLNPAQQDIMTDFFVDLCQSGRRVVIETHSEHMLGRLRRRLAEGETLDNDDVAVYYSESQGNRSTLRRIKVGSLGEIPAMEWPKGFFNEQLTNSVALARAQARRKVRVDE